MLLVIIGVCMVIIAISGICAHRSHYDAEGSIFLCILASITLVGCIIAFCICLSSTSNESALDEKIMMYQEENATIEAQMDDMVKSYMAYEGATFEKIKLDSSNAIAMITMFPELKSDTLVQAQMEVYLRNNNKIKEMKEKKISLKITRWWLWFGK